MKSPLNVYSYQEARTMCSSYNSSYDLGQPTSIRENNKLIEEMRRFSCDYAWIGVYKDNNGHWNSTKNDNLIFHNFYYPNGSHAYINSLHGKWYSTNQNDKLDC